MTQVSHSGHAYRAYDRYIMAVENQLRSRVPRIGIHDSRAVGERLLQRVVEITLWPFVAAFANNPSIGDAVCPVNPVQCDGITIDPVMGTTRITLRRWCLAIGEFFVHWLHINAAIIAGIVSAKLSANKSATLVFGIGGESLFNHEGDYRFLEFCRKGPVTTLSQASVLIVQAVHHDCRSEAPDWIIYHRFPFHWLLTSRCLGFNCRLVLIVGQMLSLFTFLALALRTPMLVLLGRDLAYINAVMELDRSQQIEAILVTNSTYASQPLWMRSPDRRHFRVQMIWYSQNTQPFAYKHDKLVSDMPNYRHIVVDEHWVWTHGYQNYLRRLGIAVPIHVVGPVLWYLPNTPAPPVQSCALQIAIFDVTPVRAEVANQIGIIGNYYSTKNILQFIQDIIAAIETGEKRFGVSIHLLLKHKRGFGKTHDQVYADFIEKACSRKRLQVVPFQTNIFCLVADSLLTIVTPWSSPAYVASFMSSPSVFYDPTGEIEPTYEPAEGLSFCSGLENLTSLVSSHITLACRNQSFMQSRK